MNIERARLGGREYLSVTSGIYFDAPDLFCGRTYLYLAAHKEGDRFWKPHTIGISIHDNDDFDLGLVYEADGEHFFDVLHELINWMYDHEQGITCYDQICDPLMFFPECDCKRKQW